MVRNHALLATLDAHFDRQFALEFLSTMVKHKSYTETEGERKLAAWMVDRMRDIGIDAHLRPVVGERVNAIGTLNGVGGGGNSLLFNGHLDTNPATEGWTVDPWGGLVDDKLSMASACPT